MVGDYVYSICRSNLHSTGQGAKMQGGFTIFRTKSMLGWPVIQLGGIDEGKRCAALWQGHGLMSDVLPGDTSVGHKCKRLEVAGSQ